MIAVIIANNSNYEVQQICQTIEIEHKNKTNDVINLPSIWKTIIHNKTSRKEDYRKYHDRIINRNNQPHDFKNDELQLH